jgi:hypothetical protein
MRKEMKKVEGELMEHIVVDDDSEILLSIEIEGRKVIDNCLISMETLKEILKTLPFGHLGWERHKIGFTV